MLKKVLLILSFVSISLMGAQSSRVSALSGFESSSQIGYTSIVPLGRVGIYDPSDVIIFPHLANKYSDFANVYYAGPNNYNAFGTFNTMSSLTIGVADYNTKQAIWGLEGLADTEGNPLNLANHTYSIFAAYNLGSIDLGLSFDYWSSHFKNEVKTLDIAANQTNTTSRTIASSISSIKASFGMDLGNNMGFDSLFKIDFGSYTNEAYDSIGNPKTILVNSPDAYTAISVGGRFFMDLSYTVKMTAWAFLDYNNEGYSELTYNTEHKKVNTVEHTKSSLLTNIGASFDIETIKDKLLITPSFGILISSFEINSKSLTVPTEGSKAKDSFDKISIPYLGLAIEYSIKSWLTIYTGYNKLVYTDTTESYKLDKATNVTQSEVTDTSKQNKTSSNFSVGISLQNNTFKFIATLNKALLTNGPNFISGTTAPMFLNATLQYKFGAPENKLVPKPERYSAPKTPKKVEQQPKKEETPKVTEEEPEATETSTDIE